VHDKIPAENILNLHVGLLPFLRSLITFYVHKWDIFQREPCTYCHVTGERSQGRQAKTWIEHIKEDFELRNMQFTDSVASYKDRTAYRQTANIINLIVIVMADKKEEEEEEEKVIV